MSLYIFPSQYTRALHIPSDMYRPCVSERLLRRFQSLCSAWPYAAAERSMFAKYEVGSSLVLRAQVIEKTPGRRRGTHSV